MRGEEELGSSRRRRGGGLEKDADTPRGPNWDSPPIYSPPPRAPAEEPWHVLVVAADLLHSHHSYFHYYSHHPSALHCADVELEGEGVACRLASRRMALGPAPLRSPQQPSRVSHLRDLFPVMNL